MDKSPNHYATCNECGRKVRNSFVERLEHIRDYHPDLLLEKLFSPDTMYSIGESIGKKISSGMR